MKTQSLSAWADALERSAGPVLTDMGFERSGAWAAAFVDDAGVRTAVAPLLLGHVCGCEAPPGAAGTLDLKLWRAVGSGAPVDASGDGALVGLGGDEAIEVATEIELSSLHALGWIARRSGEPAWSRLRSAAAWNLEELQPDNATNRPWGVGVFLWLWCVDSNAEALVHGETLWHNCQITQGRPDRLSAVILHDAAAWLRAVESDQAG